MFRDIKDAFDPLSQLNPGKVIGDDPHLMVRNLRKLPALEELPEAEPASAGISGRPTGGLEVELNEPASFGWQHPPWPTARPRRRIGRAARADLA